MLLSRLGFKGTFANDVDWDISNTLGNNTFHFYGDKTFNASLGATQTHFYDGGPQFLQNTTDLNFSKHYKDMHGRVQHRRRCRVPLRALHDQCR